MVPSERHERVRAPHRRWASDGRRAPVARRRRCSLACAWALTVLAPFALAQGAYLDPPRADPGLGGFAAQVAFGPAEAPPAAAGTTSPHGGAWFSASPPNFALEPPWTTVVVVGTDAGGLWQQATARWHAPSALTAELRSAAAFTAVAEDDTGIVGMVSAYGRSSAVEIARLYVLPSAQRRGLGRQLLAAAVAAFPDRTTARLEVEAQNPKGRAFYAHEGFVEVGERTIDAFGTALRTIVMERVGGGAPPPTSAEREP